jgi:hypothetical protein
VRVQSDAAAIPIPEGSDESSGATNTNTGGGTASVPSLIFNLVKGIVGAGVLTLPAGIAAFGDAPSAAFPGLASLASSQLHYGFGFFYLNLSGILRLCWTGKESFYYRK